MFKHALRISRHETEWTQGLLSRPQRWPNVRTLEGCPLWQTSAVLKAQLVAVAKPLAQPPKKIASLLPEGTGATCLRSVCTPCAKQENKRFLGFDCSKVVYRLGTAGRWGQLQKCGFDSSSDSTPPDNILDIFSRG